jgi:hypothetical protein
MIHVMASVVMQEIISCQSVDIGAQLIKLAQAVWLAVDTVALLAVFA